VKLLRVVQERELRRVGETRVRPVDVRLISATHRDLRQEVEHRRFRQDLYYRLHVIDLVIPPLRERPYDLRALAEKFLARTAARLQRPLRGYAPRAFSDVKSERPHSRPRDSQRRVVGARVQDEQHAG
jgi:two-component system, NtrC family, response regulator HydG